MTTRIVTGANGITYITNEPLRDVDYKTAYYSLLREYDRICYLLDKAEDRGADQESSYQRGYLDGTAKRPRPLTDEMIMDIVDRQRAKVSFDTARVGYKVARAIEAAHDIK